MVVRGSLLVLLTALMGCADAPWFRHGRAAQPAIQTFQQPAGAFFDTLDLQAEVIWLTPAVGDPMVVSDYLLILRNSDGNVAGLSDSLEIFAYGWHTSMGHGSATDGRLEPLSRGVWRNEGLRFNMPGQWELIIQIYRGDSVLDEVSVEVLVGT